MSWYRSRYRGHYHAKLCQCKHGFRFKLLFQVKNQWSNILTQSNYESHRMLVWDKASVLKDYLHLQKIGEFAIKILPLIGQIFDACYISLTRVLAPKSLKVLLNTNIFFGSKWNIFLELRHVSLIYAKHKQFGQVSTIFIERTSMLCLLWLLTICLLNFKLWQDTMSTKQYKIQYA